MMETEYTPIYNDDESDEKVPQYIPCENCGGHQEWCSLCEVYTQTCCVEWGTCECS